MKLQILKKSYVEKLDKKTISIYVTSRYILKNQNIKHTSNSVVFIVSNLTILEVLNEDIYKLYNFIEENENIIKVDLTGKILYFAKKTLKNFESLDKSLHYMTARHYNCFGII